MDCIFCKIVKGDIPSYKIYEDDNVMAFLDVNPNSPGHTLIVPKEHTLDFFSISDETFKIIIDKARDLGTLLTSKLDADGITLIQNNGISQEVKHFHLHLIPKYKRKINISIDDVYKMIMN